jgi:hypothetical protein
MFSPSPLPYAYVPMPLFLFYFIALYLLGIFLSGSLMWLYTDPSIGELFSISGPQGEYILFSLIGVLTASLSFPLSSLRV